MPLNKSAWEVLVIGAGIVGAACALELAKAGRRVAVLEQDCVGSGATAAGMGHVVVMDDSEAQLQLTDYSRTLWDELTAMTPDRHEFTRCGTLWVAADTEEFAAVWQKQALYQRYGIASQVIDRSELYRLEPNLRPDLAGGLLVPGDSVVYPPRSARYLLESCLALGGQLIAGRAVQLLPGAVRLSDGRVLESEAIIVANGARSVELVPELAIRPKKGHLLITDRYPGFVNHQLVELGYIKNAHSSEGDSVAFNVQPRATGQILIGSSRQFDAPDSEIDHPLLSKMLARAIEYMPGLVELATVRVWTGFRAATPDGLPLIGPCPNRPGLWLATGHEGLGITTSLGTARLLAAQMLDQPPPLDCEPFLPSRTARINEVSHA